MSASISERIQTEIVAAMKSKDAATLSTLRMLKSALMELKTSKSRDAVLSADEEIEVLQRYVKKRRETIELNAKAGRADLNAAEEQEIAITRRFLPEALGDEALRSLVREAMSETGASGPGDMGRLIGAVRAKAKGRAEGAEISRVVRDVLGG